MELKEVRPAPGTKTGTWHWLAVKTTRPGLPEMIPAWWGYSERWSLALGGFITPRTATKRGVRYIEPAIVPAIPPAD